jgi:hypothetical protein
MTSPSLYIAVPCFRSQVYVNCVSALMDLMGKLSAAGIKCGIQFVTSTLVGMARNDIASMFLESDFTHLLMVDDDIGGFRPEEIAALMAVDVGALPCPYRRSRGGFAAYVHEAHIRSGQVPSVTVNGQQLIEVRGAGTGVMCIRRHVFTRMIEAIGDDIAYSHDATYGDSEGPCGRRHWDFFSMGPDLSEADPARRGYFGEDMSFCRRWQGLGGKVHVLVNGQPTHFGAHEFRSDATAASPSFAACLRTALLAGGATPDAASDAKPSALPAADA